MTKEDIFLSALLSSNREAQSSFFSKRIPLAVCPYRVDEFVWLTRHREKYGKYPTIAQYNAKYPDGALKKSRASLEGCLEPLLEAYKFNTLCKENERMQKAIDEGLPMSTVLAMYKQGAQAISDLSVDYKDVALAKSDASLTRYRSLVHSLTNDAKSDLMTSPWATLNKAVGYFRTKEVLLIAARTSIGKSWQSICFAHHLANKGIKTLFLSLEMSDETIEDRFDALRFGVAYDLLRKGELPPKDLRRYVNAKRDSLRQDYPLILSADKNFFAGTGLDMVSTKIAEYKPRVVFIDGAYKFQPKDLAKNANEVARFSHISQYLGSTAKSSDCLIVAVLQQNRESEGKQQAGAKIGNIYGADVWAQDADWVLGLSGVRGSRTRDVELLKGRDSALCNFSMNFQLYPKPDFSECVGSSQPIGVIGHFNPV